jgi:hypothetical protein
MCTKAGCTGGLLPVPGDASEVNNDHGSKIRNPVQQHLPASAAVAFANRAAQPDCHFP